MHHKAETERVWSPNHAFKPAVSPTLNAKKHLFHHPINCTCARTNHQHNEPACLQRMHALHSVFAKYSFYRPQFQVGRLKAQTHT